MMLPNPLTLYIAGATLLIGAAAGYKVRDWRCDAAVANALEQAAEQAQEMQDEVDTQAISYEASRAETYGVGASVEREVRTIYETIPAPPVDCNPPAAAVSLLQGRVDHANASASSQSGE
jgi:hypothetical protein